MEKTGVAQVILEMLLTANLSASTEKTKKLQEPQKCTINQANRTQIIMHQKHKNTTRYNKLKQLKKAQVWLSLTTSGLETKRVYSQRKKTGVGFTCGMNTLPVIKTN